MRRTRLISSVLVVWLAVFTGGCGLIDLATENLFSYVGLTEVGTVISLRANIRSSYAVVAADLLEVKRNQRLEVLDEFEDQTKVLWYRVRAGDEDQTEGWIEAQHVIKESSLEKSRKLAEEEQGRQTQAIGKLRAESNLRLTPSTATQNILLRLDNGATFEIIGWQFVRKPVTEDDPAEENEEIKAAKDDEDKSKPAKIDETYDIWYKIRLDKSQSPAPFGWVFGRQVNLQVPSDIVYFQTNDRKFVTWQRLDEGGSNLTVSKAIETDVEVQKPGSWVILTRTNESKAIDGVEPDFDGILVIAFDRERQEHYTEYHTRREKIDVWGKLPIKVEGSGPNKTFTVTIRNEDSSQMEERTFEVYKRGRLLRVRAPEDLKRNKSKKKK